jgi:hypothetical protein
MICTQEKGHDGPCTAGSESGGCKKTAAKWFEAEPSYIDAPVAIEEDVAPEPEGVDEVSLDGLEEISAEELAGSSEQQLAMLYRRYVHPSSRQEAVEWAKNQVAGRDLGVGA